jgi:hypothetical protein
VDRELPQPDRERLSALTALVVLAYGLIRIVVLPSVALEFSLFGLIVRLNFDTQFVMLSLAAALAASGADWLMRSHPGFEESKAPDVDHMIVPGLAALGLGAILARVPPGIGLWIGLALAVALIVSVLVAEFVVVDPLDPRRDIAAVGLSSLSTLLLAGAFFAIRGTGLRAVFAIPLVLLAATAVAGRLLTFTTPRNRAWILAGVLGMITAQIGWGLHYLPVSPVQEALILTMVVYLGIGLISAHFTGKLGFGRWVEFGTIAVLGLTAVILLA